MKEIKESYQTIGIILLVILPVLLIGQPKQEQKISISDFKIVEKESLRSIEGVYGQATINFSQIEKQSFQQSLLKRLGYGVAWKLLDADSNIVCSSRSEHISDSRVFPHTKTCNYEIFIPYHAINAPAEWIRGTFIITVYGPTEYVYSTHVVFEKKANPILKVRGQEFTAHALKLTQEQDKRLKMAIELVAKNKEKRGNTLAFKWDLRDEKGNRLIKSKYEQITAELKASDFEYDPKKGKYVVN